MSATNTAMARPKALSRPQSKAVGRSASVLVLVRGLLRGLAHRLPLAQRLRVARGNVGIGGIGADAGQDFPGARAFAAFGEASLDCHAFDLVEAKGVGRTVA